MVLVAHFLTPVQQAGITVFSVCRVYTLFDLGLSVVLVQLAAHLFVAIRWRPAAGVRSKAGLKVTRRLISFMP